MWGTGKAMREFLYVDDMAEAAIFVLNLEKENMKKILRKCYHTSILELTRRYN